MSSQPIETDDIPKEMKNDTGTILLGHMENGSENLDVGMSRLPFFAVVSTIFYLFLFQDHPLASKFPITSGNMAVRIPSNIPAGNDYFIVCE